MILLRESNSHTSTCLIMSLRGSSIGWGPRFMKWRLLIRIFSLSSCVDMSKKEKEKMYMPNYFRDLFESIKLPPPQRYQLQQLLLFILVIATI
jgi:hypothetical protein